MEFDECEVCGELMLDGSSPDDAGVCAECLLEESGEED